MKERKSGNIAGVECENDFQQTMQVCVPNKVPQEEVKAIADTFDHHVGPMGKA